MLVPFLVVVLSSGCTGNAPERSRSEPPAEWLAWKAKREASVAGTNGWMTLVGRHWLNEGVNFAGSAATNDAVLPVGRAPASLGVFKRNGSTVLFTATPGVIAHVDGKEVTTSELRSDLHGSPSLLVVGGLSFTIIERGERLGLRIRDPVAPARLGFRGLKHFPYDPAWRFEGRFERHGSPRVLRVPDVIGGIQEFSSPGRVVFTHDGAERRLDVIEEPGEPDYFVIFRDRTAGRTTYSSGRFLYVPKADASGRVTIDFNRAYTPPCGFTPFATCPLPPAQNRLPFSVLAGEKKPEEIAKKD